MRSRESAQSRPFSYQSDLLGGSLQVREARRVAEGLLQGWDEAQWQAALVQQNLLQKPTAASARRVTRALRQRLECLDPSFWRALRDGDDPLATQVAFCATLERNLILLEFLETTVAEAVSERREVLPAYSWMEFLDEHAPRDPVTRTWTDSSRRKMGQIVLRILAEVGLLSSARARHLRPLLLRPELRQLLEHSGRQRVLSCLLRFAVGFTQGE